MRQKQPKCLYLRVPVAGTQRPLIGIEQLATFGANQRISDAGIR